MNHKHYLKDFPEAEKACREVISLPVYPELALEQQEYIVKTIRQFFKEKGLIR